MTNWPSTYASTSELASQYCPCSRVTVTNTKLTIIAQMNTIRSPKTPTASSVEVNKSRRTMSTIAYRQYLIREGGWVEAQE